jgi:hypothetical protein
VEFKFHTVTQHAFYGGKACPLVKSRLCNTHECPTPVPTAAPTMAPSSAPTATPTMAPTPAPTPPTIDCAVGKWTAWSVCPNSCCKAGQACSTQSRSRLVQIAAAHGGMACPELEATRECNIQPCPIDCRVTPFTNWGPCDRTCGGGWRKRARTIVIAVSDGGKGCPELEQTERCGTLSCPLDCIQSQWGTWSTCDNSCGGGYQNRERSTTRKNAFGGKACLHGSQYRTCNTLVFCPVNCIGEWSEYGSCSTSCGPGTKKRTLTVLRPPSYGGAACSIDNSAPCNNGPCPSHCDVGQFTAWSKCSMTCGGGFRTRQRDVIKAAMNGGYVCPYLNEKEPCNTHACPIDCTVAEWGTWETCTKSCGGGLTSRNRGVTTAATLGGKACPAEVQQKNVQDG